MEVYKVINGGYARKYNFFCEKCNYKVMYEDAVKLWEYCPSCGKKVKKEVNKK